MLEVGRTLETNRVGLYLRGLCEAFNAFYQACPVLKAADAATRLSRLHLSSLVQRTLAEGLSLLGIEAPSRM